MNYIFVVKTTISNPIDSNALANAFYFLRVLLYIENKIEKEEEWNKTEIVNLYCKRARKQKQEDFFFACVTICKWKRKRPTHADKLIVHEE